MSRPKKQTVDYFPHSCEHKKTMFILEQNYGNDGYAFWFKLLELLGSSEGHFYDCNKPGAYEFLQAKTRTSLDKCNEMLNLLVDLEAIDTELWEKRIIWCENFMDGIKQVYTNRRVEIPAKPNNYMQKPEPAKVSTGENPQSKVNETKVNETKENNNNTEGKSDDFLIDKNESIKNSINKKKKKLQIPEETKLYPDDYKDKEFITFINLIESWLKHYKNNSNVYYQENFSEHLQTDSIQEAIQEYYAKVWHHKDAEIIGLRDTRQNGKMALYYEWLLHQRSDEAGCYWKNNMPNGWISVKYLLKADILNKGSFAIAQKWSSLNLTQ